jgi:hypothetical protein
MVVDAETVLPSCTSGDLCEEIFNLIIGLYLVV